MVNAENEKRLVVQVAVGVLLLLTGAGMVITYVIDWNISIVIINSIKSIDDGILLVSVLLFVYVVRPITGLPTGLLNFATGVFLGVFPGIPFAILGTVVTALPMYAAGLYSNQLPAWIPAISWASDLGERFFDEVGIMRGMLAASFSPTPLDPVSYGAGLSGVPFGVFVTGTFAGAVLWASIYGYAGAIAGRFTDGPSSVPVAIVIFSLAVAGLLLARPIYGRFSDLIAGT